MTVAHAATFVTALDDAALAGTGCLLVADATGTRSGRVYFRDAKVYAVHVNGFMPKIGQRLVTGGMLAPDQYAHLLTLVGGDIYAPTLGTLAVENGYVTSDVLVAVSREILLSSVGAMFTWEDPKTKFKANRETDQFTVPPISVTSLAKAVTKRRARWEELWNEVAPGMSPEHTYPTLSVMYRPGTEEKSPEIAAVVAAADATRSLDDMAGACGLTRFEIAHVLGHLVGTGTLDMSPYPTGDAAPTATESHGTAESAISEATETTHEPAEYVEPGTSFVAEGPVDETPGEAPAVDGPQFAPDVIETLAHVPDDVSAGPSAFGMTEAALPDGMDLGTIPTDQIENDPDDLAPTAEVPPLTGMAQHASELSGYYADHTPTPEPTPVPVPVPVLDVSPVPPAFVDTAAFDRDRLPVEAHDDGMPEVPLPPLPTFLPAPEPDFQHLAHVPAPEAPETHEAEPTAHVQDEGLAHVPAPEAPETHEAEPTAHVQDEGLALVTVTDTVTGEQGHGHGDIVETPAPEPTGDDRLDAARRRLHDEILTDTRMVASAEAALTRVEADHAAHTEEAAQIAETLTGYQRFLDEAAADHERLQHEAAQVNDERETLAVDEAAIEDEAALADEALAMVTETMDAARITVKDAREALRLAEAALTEAEQAVTDTLTANETIEIKTAEVAARKSDLDVRSQQIAADMAEVEERVKGYQSEVEQVSAVAATVEAAAERVVELREAAQARLDAARTNLVAKQERLANLG